MAKDKKKKKDKKKSRSGDAVVLVPARKVKGGKKATALAAPSNASKLLALADNRLVADVVAAALVATAAAIKDSKKARQLAEHAGDELEKLSKESADKGSAMWQLALEVGRRSLEALAGEDAPKRRKSAPRAAKSPAK